MNPILTSKPMDTHIDALLSILPRVVRRPLARSCSVNLNNHFRSTKETKP
jgi:hypothetical protein